MMSSDAIDMAIDIVKVSPATAPYVATLFGVAIPAIVQYATLFYVTAVIAHWLWGLVRDKYDVKK